MTERLPNEEPSPENEPENLTDTDRVNRAVDLCAEMKTDIPPEVARAIASLIAAQEPSMFTHLLAFARTGAIDAEGIEYELTFTWNAADMPPEIRKWIRALTDYTRAREDKGPVEGWQDLWVSEGVDQFDNCTICGEHLSSPHQPDCSRNDVEAELSEPGSRGDIRRLLHDEAGGLFGRAELRRMENALMSYLQAHYVPVDEVAVMNTDIRREEVKGMTEVVKELLNGDEIDNAMFVIGAMTKHLEGRTRAMRRLKERKPE